MKKGYGLVLAGGGTKGAYEVGAWKALKELEIDISAIVGTSIGAINGALFLQDDYDKVLELYDNIRFEDLVKLSEENKMSEGNIFSTENIIKFTKEFTRNRGLENAPMRDLMEKYIDIDKVYNSKIDYGMVTTSIDMKNKSLEVFKEDINKEELYEYILASACFPIFKPQKIGDKQYLDGGMHDNVPVNMLLNKGYTNIIVIDISNGGISRRLQNKDAYIKIIKPNEDLGGPFDFDKKRIKKNMKMGYLDTMKSFNKLQGHYYYFDKKDFEKFIDTFNLKTIYGLEIAANLYDIELYKVYSYENFLKELYDIHNKYLEEYKKMKKGISDMFEHVKSRKNIQEIVNKKMGLCLFMDVVTLQPKYNKNKIVNKLFGEYKEAGDAMVELINYMNG
ncbi:MAG: patatin-like phospholipase family protein [Clostridia bacterium]